MSPLLDAGAAGFAVLWFGRQRQKGEHCGLGRLGFGVACNEPMLCSLGCTKVTGPFIDLHVFRPRETAGTGGGGGLSDAPRGVRGAQRSCLKMKNN